MMLSWFELVGAFSQNVHEVSSIMFVISVILTLTFSVFAILTNDEYGQNEFISLSKSFVFLSVLLGILACAPTPKDMQKFSGTIEEMVKSK